MISVKQLEKLAIDNAPTILTVVGAVGTVTTALLTAKGAIKAERILSEEPPSLPRKEYVKLVWKCYIPPVISGGVTVGAIIFANRIGSKRAAAVATAFALSEKAATEYREKVIETVGKQKHQQVVDELAREQIERNPPGNIVIVGDGDTLCCDLFTGRYFRSSVEAIKKAVNDTNYQINHHQMATLTDFYDRVGLSRTDFSDEVGWNVDKLMDVEFTTVLAEDGRTPCVAYRFQVDPVRGVHSTY